MRPESNGKILTGSTPIYIVLKKDYSLKRLNHYENIVGGGRLYFNQGETDKAIAQFQNTLKINPNHLDSLYSMALALEKQRKRAEALTYIKKALALNPENQILEKKFEDLNKY